MGEKRKRDGDGHRRVGRRRKKLRWGWRAERERWRERGKIDRRRVLLSLGAVRSIGCGTRYWCCILSVWSNTLQTPSLTSSSRESGDERGSFFFFFLCPCAHAFVFAEESVIDVFVYLKWVNPKQNKHNIYSGCDVRLLAAPKWVNSVDEWLCVCVCGVRPAWA